MNKIIIPIFLIALITGCAAIRDSWKIMEFHTNPEKTDAEFVAARADCIAMVDADTDANMWAVLGGATGYNIKKSDQFQDCMAAKGFVCKKYCGHN